MKRRTKTFEVEKTEIVGVGKTEIFGVRKREIFLIILGNFPPATCLDWALSGVLCEEIDTIIEVTPQKVKGVEWSL